MYASIKLASSRYIYIYTYVYMYVKTINAYQRVWALLDIDRIVVSSGDKAILSVMVNNDDDWVI